MLYPNQFPQVEAENKPQHDIMGVPYYEGDDKPMLRKQVYRTLFACACSIYEIAAWTSCPSVRNSIIKRFHTNDGERPTTSSQGYAAP